jgi:hypothetical protein
MIMCNFSNKISVTDLIAYGFTELEAKRAYHHFFFRGTDIVQIEHVVEWILNIRQQHQAAKWASPWPHDDDDGNFQKIDADVLNWPRAGDVHTLVQQYGSAKHFSLKIKKNV